MACDAVGGRVVVVSQSCDRCERGSVQYCPTAALSRPTDWPPPSPPPPPPTGFKERRGQNVTSDDCKHTG